MAYQVLVVDDEKLIVKGIKFSLEQDGMEVTPAYDGEEALQYIKEKSFDLVVLDVMLPKMDGLQVCQATREFSQVPIIMVTEKGEDMDKIMGLEYGADDYMTKPFNILEVKARVKAILRRSSGSTPDTQIIRVRDLEIDLLKRTVTLAGQDVQLTAKEFDLLHMFITNRGKVFNRQETLETLWKYDYTGDGRTVDVHIRRLREKIEHDTAKPEFILTKWGVGYYFNDSD